MGRLGSFSPLRGANDGLGDGSDGLVLADHPAMQLLLQVQQLLYLALQQLAHGNVRPPADDGGDVLLGDFLLDELSFAGSFRCRLQEAQFAANSRISPYSSRFTVSKS